MKKEINSIIFVEKKDSSVDFNNFREINGYLESFIDRGIFYNNIVKTEIWKPEDFDLWFYNEPQIKQKVLSLSGLPEKYIVIKAEIKNNNNLEKRVRKFCERFCFQYFFIEDKKGVKKND